MYVYPYIFIYLIQSLVWIIISVFKISFKIIYIQKELMLRIDFKFEWILFIFI